MEQQNEDRWVKAQMKGLAPQWSPNPQKAHQLLEKRMARPSLGWMTAAAAAAVCLLIVAMPSTRAMAQELWMRLTLYRVDVVRLDLSKSPLKANVTIDGGLEEVRDLEQAAAKAGFRPYLPPRSVLNDDPRVVMMGTMEFKQVVHVRDIEAALVKAGARDVPVPPAWEGLVLRARIGPVVGANYADGVEVLQARPMEMSLPRGFPLQHFVEVLFRSLGMSRAESIAMGQRFAANPSWLMDIPPDEVANVQEVDLKTGKALVIEDFDDRGKTERVAVIRSTHERTYVVNSKRRDVSIRIAESLP